MMGNDESKKNVKSKIVSAPTRFVGMHAHSGFSTFDGMGYPQEHIDYVLQNGMNAWCLTDHGHMNGFAHAYLHTKKLLKSGIDFKFVPGCEMYLHPDLDQWKQDYLLSKEAKSGNKNAEKKVRDRQERIVTPLAAIVDRDDDPIRIEVDDASLTIEDEDETKTSKFYDPIKRRHHLVVLPKTSEGLQRLFSLVSKGYSEGFYRFPRIDYSMLKEAAKGGHLMITSACLTGDVKLVTDKGELSLAKVVELVNNGEVVNVNSYNESTKKTEFQTITWGDVTRKNAELLRITSVDGDYVTLTPDHKVYTNEGWVEAQKLFTNKKLKILTSDFCLNTIKFTHKFSKLKKVEKLDYTEDVYDITVENNHNFFANNILVHNCAGGNLAYEVYQHIQELTFDELRADLLDDPHLMDKVMNSIGNEYGRMVDAVGLGNAYLELQFNKLPAQHLLNRALLEFANRNNLQNELIVTCDSHYVEPDHWREREIYKKLGWLGNKVELKPEMLPNSKDELKCELYPKNAIQVWETYQYTTQGYDFYDCEIVKNAIERTSDIVHDRIGTIEPDTSIKLPNYVIPAGMTENNALIEACKEGLIKIGKERDPVYIDRIKYELGVIKDMNFSKYFLTTKKIVDIARSSMFIGTGRGSAAGSLVAYVLGLHSTNPIEYNLLFERFLNVNQDSYPDIDIDFSDRDKLISLLQEELGEENIVPISNYLTMKLKSLIKDLSKFYGIEFQEVNKALASLERDVKNGKKIDDDASESLEISLEDALKYSKNTSNFLDKYPEIRAPLEVLFKQNRALGKHAGGVIISENIADRMPLIKTKGVPQTPWVEGMHYKHLESMGWIKFDLLGLGTLRLFERTIELILKKNGIANPTFSQVQEWFNENMAPEVIDFNDQKVYKNVYHKGKWVAIFQCTQKGSQALYKRAKPENIIDLATLSAIYRPGPLGAKVDKIYIDAKKNPESVDYGHPLIEEVLKDTYGCIIFQETVMEICNKIAGFPKDECNAIRKMLKPAASGTENQDKVRKLKDRFISGCEAKGVATEIAENLYERILYFSSYGFNKSHSVSYGIISYYCAWLLTYYETEWITAYLEAESGTKKASKAFAEVKALGYEIVPIDINYASDTWTLVGKKKLMPSFSSCKGVGDAAVLEVMKNRPYKSIEDFLWKENGAWKHNKFNKRCLEALIKIRAFDSLECVGKDKQFETYRHMHDVIIENFDSIKKTTKKNPDIGRENFSNMIEEFREQPDWDFKQLLEFDNHYLGTVDLARLLPKAAIEVLEELKIEPLDNISTVGKYWFVATAAVEKKSKNGNKYFLLDCISSSNKVYKMFCWGADFKPEPPLYSLLVSKVKQSDFGLATNYSDLKSIKL